MAAFRPDIQALRAIAVLLVLAFHVWPTHVHGGYIGVDVFFVISGYLITGHLLREVASTGRVDLLQFYARRARRLLPAASLTLVAVGLASYMWMPSWTWATTAADIAASTGYAENWMLVRRAVDYQAQYETPSPLQHFWSLAVEEQFYFGWPLLVAGVAWLWQRTRDDVGVDRHIKAEAASFATLPATVQLNSRPSPALPVVSSTMLQASSRAPPRRAWFAAPMAALCAASFWAALFHARAGYFTTHTRLYELGMGGLLAVLGGARPRTFAATLACTSGTATLKTWLRTLVAAAGLAAIGASAALMTARTPFPGAAALVPTLGGSALLWAGEQDAVDGAPAHALVAPMSHPLFQFIGDISYSLYLAHWPVVVIYPFATGRVVEGALADGVLVCVISVALAHACKRLWEDRFRSTGGGGGGNAPKQQSESAVHTSTAAADEATALFRQGSYIAAADHATPGSGANSFIRLISTTRRCRLSSGAGALFMTLLMVTATLSAAYALHKAAPAQVLEGEALVPAEPQPQGDAAPSSPPRPPLPPSSASDKFFGANATHPYPGAECSDFYGPRASRPHPGADVLFYGCSELNSLPVFDAIPRLGVATKEFSGGDVTLSWNPPNASDTKGHIMLIGDSQARMSWGPAFGVVARHMGFKFTNLGQNSCPPTLEVVRLHESSQARPRCRDSMQRSLNTVLREKPSVVILVAADRYSAAASNSSDADVADGVVRAVKQIVAEGIPVLGIKATPHGPESVPACLMRAGKLAERNPNNTSACSMVADVVLKVSCVEAAARTFPVLRLMSFDDYLCQNSVCPPIIGNVIVYRDALHLTSAYSKTLANALQKEMLAALPHLASLVSS